MEKITKEKAVETVRGLLLSGMRVKDDDSGELIAEVQAIFDAERRTLSKAVKDYMAAGDLDALFLFLLPVYNRIFYEAYAAYWLKHCKPVNDRDSDAVFTYYNDLIDMYWVGKWDEWKTKGKWEVRIMLPPTKGLIALEYRRECQAVEAEE